MTNVEELLNKETITVCVCGGGNGSHMTAGYIGTKPGYVVNVLTRQPQKWIDGTKEKGGLTVICRKVGETEEVAKVGKLNKISDKAEEVAPDADIFILGGPAHANPQLLKQIAPHAKKGALVGCLYGQGAFDWAACDAFGGVEKLKERDITLFGLQNIPWICKATTYGSVARMIGPKKFLLVTSYPIEQVNSIAKLMEKLFDIPCRTLPNFLCLTLTPSNQIIHPGRYYGIFHEWDGKKTYEKKDIPLLYEGLDDFSAKHLQDLSDELQLIRKAIEAKYPQIDLSSVMDLGERIIDQYDKDVSDRTNLRTIFATNKGYAGVLTPVVDLGDGKCIPNVKTRFFYEDIPFGLCILHNMGEILGVKTPVFDFFIRWHQQYMPEKYLLDDGTLNPQYIPEIGAPIRYGIKTVEEMVALSLPQKQ